MKHYFNNFENRASSDRYTYRTIENYDEIKKENIISSTEIHRNLIDTYQQFDWTVLSSEQDYMFETEIEEKYGVEIEEFYRNFDAVSVLETMAEASLEYIVGKIGGLKARVVSVNSPSEYNYMTDSFEIEVLENPFETIEELIEEMKSVVLEDDDIREEYIFEMIECIDMAMIDNATGLTINGKEYETEDDFRKTLK